MDSRTVLCLVLSASVPMACSGPMEAERQKALQAAEAEAPAKPDYDQATGWLARPSSIDKPVDVFYVYPTIYMGTSPMNMDVGDEALRAAAQGCLAKQASVYSGQANLFAPYYRQMSIAGLKAGESSYENPYFRVGVGDVERAFDYYLEHLNGGRPFILAGHSQGTNVLIDLMKRRFRDESLQKRLVAAYLIGYSVTDKDLKACPWMKIAQHVDDTGVIITYNTQAPNATDSPVLLPGAKCVNPLSWTTSDTYAGKDLNAGAVFFDKQGKIDRDVPHYCSARIEPFSGALVTQVPEDLGTGNAAFPPGVYHAYDYTFYYRNLERNVGERIRAYRAQGAQ